MEANISQSWRRLVLEHRVLVTAVLVLPMAMMVRPSRVSLVAGLPLIVLGEALRLWASGHIHKMREVATTGPYALCRHPLYLGHFFITAGFVVAGNSPWVALLAVIGFWLIFQPTMEREEGMLRDQFGADYEAYMQTTPRFWPRWRPTALVGGHSWALVRQHREINNILGLAAGLGVLAGFGLWWGTW